MDKRQLLLKQKMLLATIMLSTTVLSGCSKDNTLLVNSSVITYEDNSRHGSIMYEDLEHVLIIRATKNNNEYTKLAYMMFNSKDQVFLYDIETGDLLEDYNVISSESITKYIAMADYIRFDYEISEIIDFYHSLIDENKLSK